MQDSRFVRHPVRANTDLVRAVLEHLARCGVTWAPRFVGLGEGEEIVSWLPGTTMDDWRSKPERLDQLTGIVRQLHDLTAEMVRGQECMVHDDLQPRNVVTNDESLGLIDWEQLRPGRLYSSTWRPAKPDFRAK